jgi:Na+/proline symporter
MSAVLWTDLLQLSVYLLGAGFAAIVLYSLIPGGLSEIAETAGAAGRFQVFDFSWNLSRNYTFWTGLIGGSCLTLSTHGTDQLVVQRYLCSQTQRGAAKALLLSGAVVLVQFSLFLIIGVMLYVYYTGYAPDAILSLSGGGPVPADRIFPMFIVTQLPNGISGLLVAAIVAAAMSTLSSSLNASAAATLGDFYMPATQTSQTPQRYLTLARRSTIAWGLVQLLVACVAIEFSQQVIDEVLSISSFSSGLILGIFFLGLLGYTRRSTAYSAISFGALTMLSIQVLTEVSWQWYALLGTVATLLAGLLANGLAERRLNA